MKGLNPTILDMRTSFFHDEIKSILSNMYGIHKVIVWFYFLDSIWISMHIMKLMKFSEQMFTNVTEMVLPVFLDGENV